MTTMNPMNAFVRSIVRYLFHRLSSTDDNDSDGDSERDSYSLSVQKLARLSIEVLFFLSSSQSSQIPSHQQQQQRQMKKAVFLQEWVACTPSLETLDSALYASLWRGLLLETVVDGGPVVLFHPSEDQPEGLVQRFQALFARKKAFSSQELAPYFEDCVWGLNYFHPWVFNEKCETAGSFEPFF